MPGGMPGAGIYGLVGRAAGQPGNTVRLGFLVPMVAAVPVLAGGITRLASATVPLLLGVFACVNLALLVLPRRPGEPRGSFGAPGLVAAAGARVWLALSVNRVMAGDWRAPALAGAIVVAGGPGALRAAAAAGGAGGGLGAFRGPL